MASINKGTGVQHDLEGTFTLTPLGGSGATINGIVKNFAPKANFANRKEIMSQTDGIAVGIRDNDRRINASCSLNYLTAGTTVYAKPGDKVAVTGMTNTDYNVTFYIAEVGATYKGGEDVEVEVTLEYREGVTL